MTSTCSISGWDQPILVGCCPSSGSTLLSVMLDAHPQVFCGPELAVFSHEFLWRERGPVWQERLLRYTQPGVDERSWPDWTLRDGVCEWIGFSNPLNFAWHGTDVAAVRERIPLWPDVESLIEHFYRRPLGERGKSRWSEKSPTNIYALRGFLDVYPAGRAVLMVRDGRDVVCSLLKRDFPFLQAAAIWTLETALCLTLSEHPRVCVLRYEDLVLEPRPALERLTAFLDIEPGVERLLGYHESHRAKADASIVVPSWRTNPTHPLSRQSIERWRIELSPLEILMFENFRLNASFPGLESRAGQTGRDLLLACGYAPESAEIETPEASELTDFLLAHMPKARPKGAVPFHLRYAAPDYDRFFTPLQLHTFNRRLAARMAEAAELERRAA